MDFRDKILAMAKEGPLLPMQVAKAVNQDMLIASAMLSELSAKGLLKVSNLKIGSSPLYYNPENGAQLQNYVNYLNQKERQAYELLKQKKVVRECTLDPLMRVCIKNIKDFSRPLEVTFNNQKEIFWKWYLSSDEEISPMIKEMLNKEQIKTPEPEKVEEPKVQQEPKIKEETPKVEKIKEKIKTEKPQTKKKAKKIKKKIIKEKPIEKPTEELKTETKLKTFDDTPKTLDPFYNQILDFFKQNKIHVIEQTIIKKKADYEFLIQFESVVGNLNYLCKVKNKKRISDSDLNNAFVQGQLKKLPVIILTPGELTKKAQEIQKELKGLTIKHI